MRSVGGVLIFPYLGREPLNSVAHRYYNMSDLRLPSQLQDRCRVTGTTLYCLLREVHVYGQLVQDR